VLARRAGAAPERKEERGTPMSLPATDIVVMILLGVMFASFMVALWITLRPLNKVIADLKKLEIQLREFGQRKTSAPEQENEMNKRIQSLKKAVRCGLNTGKKTLIVDIDVLAAVLNLSASLCCEHGIADGDWCEECNKEYERAVNINA
jgi:hypothetical protein